MREAEGAQAVVQRDDHWAAGGEPAAVVPGDGAGAVGDGATVDPHEHGVAAGVALAGTVADMTFDDFMWLTSINFLGVVHGTMAFLPHLKAAGEGHVVNISSVFGLISVPGQSAYNASKFAVLGFTDALRMELEAERCGVSATTVHPGGVKTNIAKSARGSAIPVDFDKIAMTKPERAARQILTAVARNRRRVAVGPDAKAIDLVSRLPAGIYQRVLVAGARRRLTSATEREDAHD